MAVRTRHFHIEKTRLGLAGIHQTANARLAVGAIELLKGCPPAAHLYSRISSRHIAEGLEHVSANTGLRGRLELADTGLRFIFDVAHNAQAMEVLARAISSLRIRNIVAVFGVMKDKAYTPMLDELSRVASVVIPVAPKTRRAMNSMELERVCTRRGIPVRRGGTVREGLRKASTLAGPSGHILVTGSHYVVGEALRFLQR